jgi:Zn-dependent protease
MVLFILNMLPIPPLDGWSALNCFFPQLRGKLAESELLKGGLVFSFLLVMLFSKYLFLASIFASQHVVSFFAFLLKTTGLF